MSVSYWQDNMTTSLPIAEVDVAIVGGGLAGTSIAYWLRKKDPSLKVLIVEKSSIGSGASGRNAGFITCGSTEHFSRMTSAYGSEKAAEIWKFTEQNHELLLSEFGQKNLEDYCEYRRKGSWTLAATEHEIEVIQNSISALQGQGVRVGWFGKEEVEKTLHCEGFYGGAKYFDDGEIHPIKLLSVLLANSQAGLLLWSEVYKIEQHDNHLMMFSKMGRVKTQAVILATNGYSGLLFDYFKDKVVPTRGQIIATSPVEQFLEPCYCGFVLDYFRQLIDGTVLIGGFRNADVEKEVGYSDEINPIINQKLEEFLHAHFPLLREVDVSYRWSGVMGFSRDSYPLVGSLPQESRIYFAVGFTGHGLGFTFNIGRTLVDLMLDGKDPGIFTARRLE